MKIMWIERNGGIIHIYASDGQHGAYPSRLYYGYTEREAVRLYRAKFGLTGKHFRTIRRPA